MCLYPGACERSATPIVENNAVADKYIKAMSRIVGGDVRSGSRVSSYLWGRNFVAYQLHKEGLSFSRIGHILNRHHATIMHSIKSAETAIEYPKSYANAIYIWNAFKEQLSLQKTMVI